MSTDLSIRAARLSPERRKILDLRMGARRRSAPAIIRVSRDEALPLSFSQQRLWFLDQLEPGSSVYNTFQAVHFKGALNLTGLHWALEEVARRHEILRTSFPSCEGRPVQRISPAGPVALPVVDVSNCGQALASGLARAEALRPFDLVQGPVWRAVLLHLGVEDHALLLTIHHIASDGWSLGVLVSEFTELYTAWCEGRAHRLPELPVQYADYSVWERQWLSGPILENHLAYWKNQLASVTQLELPTDRPRPPEASHLGSIHRFRIKGETAAALREISRRTASTLYMTLVAVFGVLLSKYSGQSDIVIGTPVANRNTIETETLIGFFVNSLVLRWEVNPDQSFTQTLSKVRSVTLSAYEHQALPFLKLVEELAPARDMSRSPLFQVEFVLQNAPPGNRRLPGVQMNLWEDQHDRVRFDLTLAVREQDSGELSASFEYATALFDAETIERMAQHYCQVLETVSTDPDRRLKDVQLLSPTEQHQILKGWNETEHATSNAVLPDLFERQVERTPDAVAVTFESEVLSYAELNRRANRLAHLLITSGVGPEDTVGVALLRSAELVVALLAIVKCGAAFLPLDPEYPVQRLALLIGDARPKLVLTSAATEERLSSEAWRTLRVDNPAIDAMPCFNPGDADRRLPLRADHPAYVIHTSGSTGQPKGVVNTHAGIINRLEFMQSVHPLTASDRVLQKTAFTFDVSVPEFFWPLLYGAQLVVATPGGHRDPIYLAEIIESARITIIHFVPAMLEAFLEQQELSCRSLRLVMCSGEALSSHVQEKFLQRLDVPLYNLYGPTEASVEVTAWHCQPNGNAARVPIGRPIWNTALYVLDEDLKPVPVGVAGDLFIAGRGLARGYLRRAPLTAESFIPNPYGVPGSRMYRTGDRARWLSGGVLDYLGRADGQVKLRGMRVELGEVESALQQHPGVVHAAAMVHDNGSRGQRLTAYYTCAPAETSVDATELQVHLSAILPEHMVPSVYVRLEEWPLTSSGKLDRKALPEPEAGTLATSEYVSPQSGLEVTLAGLWSDVLKIPRVGRRDNFFRLGGHSLLVIELIHRMRELGLQTDVKTIFTTPTLAALAAALQSGGPAIVPPNRIPTGCESITPNMVTLIDLSAAEIERIVTTIDGGARNVQDIYPLSALQEGILFHHLIGSEGDPYLMGSLFSYDTRSQLDSYLDAVQAVVNRHDILRSSVVWDGLREPVQVVWRNTPLPVEEIALDPAGGDPARQLYEMLDPRRYRMDLARAPLVRIYIAHDPATDKWLVMQMVHHLVFDHTALQVAQKELEAHLLGTADRLPQPLPFRDFIGASRLGAVREEQEAFFRRMLADVSETTAPFGLVNVLGDGTGIKEAGARLSSALVDAIKEMARCLDVSAASICHVAWAQVLSRVSQREDVVFGTVLFGRMLAGVEAERVIGPFINALPIRIQLGSAEVGTLVRETHMRLAELMRHEHASLVLAQRCSSVPAPSPLFSALLNYRYSPDPLAVDRNEAARAWQGLRGIYGEERTNYPFTLSIDDYGKNMAVTAQVQGDVDPRRLCDYMITCLESLVEALGQTSSLPARQLNILPEDELRQLVHDYNNTQKPYPARSSVVELFDAQAAARPDAVAVVFEDRHMTYESLKLETERLARKLIRLGIQPDDRVGLYCQPCTEMVIGLLGILRAGAAYVPLDPDYPVDRLEFMLHDSQVPALVCHHSLPGGLQGDAIQVVLDSRLINDSSLETEESLPSSNPDNLAYVMYTSGSTGRPKAVSVPHSALMNYLSWAMENYPAQPGGPAVVHSSIGFDLTVTSIFPSLLQGTGIRILPAGRGAEALVEELRRNAPCNILKLTPSHLQVIQPELEQVGSVASSIVVGGEALGYVSLAPWMGKGRLINEYGPTETVVGCSIFEVPNHDVAEGAVPIGRPIANTQLYVLDEIGSVLPFGATGELCVGGAGVARGYLNRPGLTAERFVPDPYGGRPGARLFLTRDLVRWRSDGNLDYLGRIDEQVKIRGYRVELGEIEAALRAHPGVSDAAVCTYTHSEDTRLVGYVTQVRTSADEEHLRASVVQEWNQMYELVYAEPDDAPADFNLAGWTSAYTGDPIPPEEMRQWVDHTVAHLQSLGGRRILEIGCGSGLLLMRLAATCDSYIGLDFSATALEHVRQVLSTRQGMSHVELHQATANELGFLEDSSVDLVILNSVAQYFPDMEYLAQVLTEALRVTRPGGHVFMGDVRNLSFLEAYHTSVQLHRAPPNLPAGELRQRVDDAIRRERELLVSPEFFADFARRVPKAGRVLLSPKIGAYDNELSRFRFDVTITVEDKQVVLPPERWIDWDPAGRWQTVLENLRSTGSANAVGVRGIRDRRVAGAIAAARLLFDDSSLSGNVAHLREVSASAEGEDINDVVVTGVRLGSPVYWQDLQSDGLYSAIFWPRWGRATTLSPKVADSHYRNYGRAPSHAANRQFETELREFLRRRLPEYMVPSAIMAIESIPLTRNGKLDRRALPKPEAESLSKWRAPRTPQEEVLCGLFAEVLGVERIGLDDHFFELGGHSLTATRLVSRIRAVLDVDLPIRSVFECPTVGLLAPNTVVNERTRSALVRRQRPSLVPVSYAQQRMLFIDSLSGSSSEYNIVEMVSLSGGELHLEALERSVATILERHESLRTHFAWVDGEAIQVIAPELRMEIPVENLTSLDEVSQRRHLAEAMLREQEKPFDLTTGPLLRFNLFQLGPGEYVLIRAIHHIVTDGWSQAAFDRELAVLYAAFRAGRECPLKPLPVQYADFALWQREWLDQGELAAGLQYWREQLAGIPHQLELPTDRPRPPAQTFGADEIDTRISAEQTVALRNLSQWNHCTLYMTMLAAFGVVAARYSGQQQIVVGSPIANRHDSQLEEMIGLFVNNLALRLTVDPDITFRQLLGQVRQMTLDAYRYQEIPFEKVVEEISPPRSLNVTPIYQVLFALQNTPSERHELQGLSINHLEAVERRVRLDLEVHATEQPGGIIVGWLYNHDLFDKWRIDQMSRHYLRVLEQATENPDVQISAIDLLTGNERHQILAGWNDTARAWHGKTLLAQFESQVAATPDAIAVVFEDTRISYGELNRRANSLARQLVGLGAGSEDLVGLVLPTSADMITAIVAVLKTGAAYLPIDATQPAQRLAYFLEDARPLCIVTTPELSERLPGANCPLVILDRDSSVDLDTDLTDQDRVRHFDPMAAAYVLYTSGSTGKPKGVVVTHQSAAHLIDAVRSRVSFGSRDAGAVFHSIGADISVWEIWAPLISGGRLVVVPFHVSRSPSDFRDLLIRERVTMVSQTPAALYQLLQADMTGASGQSAELALTTIVVGGEPLEAARLRSWRRCQTAPHVTIFNMYGPTEVTVWASSHTVTEADWDEAAPLVVTIGCPLPNYGIFILGPDLEPVPPGIAGEIYIAGLGLARAYHNRSALTAEKFVPHPFADSPGQRLYRSGDLGRWLPGGKVEFLGRADEQVKLRGYRIELGEIESVLLQQPGVGQVAVTIREDEPGEKKIVAYVTPGKSDPDVTQIIAGLRAALPEYMIPSAIMTLDQLPLSSNGKLDRKALPKPLRTGRGISTSVRSYPRDNTETLVAQIWANVLGVDEVDIHSNFFDLGGHSMSAVVVAAKLSNMYGRRISVGQLFQSPTVEQFSSYLRQDVAREPAGTIVPIQLRGSLPPLFCVHPAGGLANAYVQLARQLGPAQPLYAFQAAGFEESHVGHTSIEAMAAAYVSDLRAVAPAGPYRLLGWSLGGLIAYEMAQQLVSAGQTVSFLALLDSAAIVKPIAEPRPRSSTSRRNFVPAQERRLANRLALAQAAGKVPHDVSAEQYREFRELYARNVVAGRAYRPKPFLGSCPITLLSTHVETGNPTRGWGALSHGRVNVIEVPCHHEEMVFAPYVSLTATIIRDAMDASTRE